MKDVDFRMPPQSLTRAMRGAAAEPSTPKLERPDKPVDRLDIVGRAFQVSVAVKRHHDKHAQLWVSQRYADLLRNEGSAPAMRPSWAMDDPKARLKRKAELEVAHKLANRLDRVERTARRMLGRSVDRDRGLGE